MRIRSKKDFKKQKLGLVVVLLVPVVLLGSIFGMVSYLYAQIPSFGMDESKMPPVDSFTPGDYDLLDSMASVYDQRYKDYHIPLNYTVPAHFTNTSYTNVSYYSFTDNGGLWSGTAMAAYVGKYLAGKRENDTTLVNEALDIITRLTHGMSMMLAVPNGGLGPEHGSLLARFWAAPDDIDVPGMPLFGDDDDGPRPYAYCNGTGPYSQYRYSDFTSLDEHGGYYMGIALAFKYILKEDAPEVHETLKLVIDQLCTGMQQTNFLGIGGFGGPTGTDQKSRFFQGGSWVLLLLKMGMLAYPEKYTRVYYHYAVEEGYAYYTHEGGAHEIVANYYAYNFGIDVTFALLMLEKDPVLQGLYLKNFMQGMWSFVKTHRNCHFNSIYLIVNRFEPGENEYYERDVEDQLMEFQVNHFPDVVDHVDPPTNEYEFVDMTPWENFFQYNPIGSALAPLFFEFDLDKGFYDRPLTVSMRRTRNYIWGGNPFQIQNNETNILREMPGLSFLTPYWLMRGFGFIKNTGVRPT